MRLAALISGGKDSTLALYRALQEDHTVKCLVTMIPQREDSWMFHFPNTHLTNLVSKAVRIPLVKRKTIGIKERELQDLKDVLSTLDIDGVVSGAISSSYQKKRVDNVCRELHLSSFTPLWGEDPISLLNEMIQLDFHIVIVGVYAYGFDRSWLGRTIDRTTIETLAALNKQYKISPVGEGGEYESLVLDTSFFHQKIRLLQTRQLWRGDSGYVLVEKAELTDKPLTTR